MNIPEIKPVKNQKYTCKQSKYDNVDELPMRIALVGPSQSGKTTLITNMILNIYRGCFERIYIFSASINIDASWKPVKDYIENELNINTQKEKVFFEDNDFDNLNQIINNQKHVIEYLKHRNIKQLYNILIVFDDMLDSGSMKHNSLLTSLYVRGRHFNCSVITSTQMFRGLDSIIRKNLQSLYVFRLSHFKEYEAIAEEVSNFVDKKTFRQLYKIATDEPFNFLLIRLKEKNIDNIFWSGYGIKLNFT